MGNVVGVTERRIEIQHEQHRAIKDMQPGETGFTAPWAYDEDGQHLNPDASVVPVSGGTATLKVKCITKGKYRVHMVDIPEWIL